MHDLSEQTRKLLDIGAALFATAAAVTLNEVATVLTIISCLVATACGSVRLWDRFKYGRSGRD